MTRVKAVSGICGFSTTVTAEMGEGGKEISITLESECEMVGKMSVDLASLSKMSVFTGFMENPVYKSAAAHLKHVACPVPSGILKAMEVEAGFCLPKDAIITFII